MIRKACSDPKRCQLLATRHYDDVIDGPLEALNRVGAVNARGKAASFPPKEARR